MGPSGNRTIIVRVGGFLIIPFVLLLGLISSASGEEYNNARGDCCGGDHDNECGDDGSSGGMHMHAGKTYGEFPGVGKAYAMDLGLGGAPAQIYFESERELSFMPEGAEQAQPFEAQYTALPVGEGEYLIGWHDAQGQTMAAALDFSSGEIMGLKTQDDGSWLSYSGVITPASVNSGSYLASAMGDTDTYKKTDWPAGKSPDFLSHPSAIVVKPSETGWEAGSQQDENYGSPGGIVDAPGQMEGDYVPGPEATTDPAKCRTLLSKQLNLRNDMRRLWDDHVTWTRNYIISTLGGLPDQQTVTERLLQNQSDIGTAFSTYFGAAAGAKLTILLKQHIAAAGDVVAAAKAKDNSKLAAASLAWSKNANELAAYLNSVNPDYWPLDQTTSMLQQHLSLTTAEVQARLKGDWQADIKAYDQVHQQSLEMADTLSNGIIMQFPDRFN